MYHPNENNYFDDQLSVYVEKVNINTSDNIKLLGWYHEKDLKKHKTIIFFHGNAGSLENRIHKLNHLQNWQHFENELQNLHPHHQIHPRVKEVLLLHLHLLTRTYSE